MISKYDLLQEYFINERDRLAADVAQLQENIRYRRISSVDCLELIIAQERLSAFTEFSHTVRLILRLRMSEREENGEDENEKT